MRGGDRSSFRSAQRESREYGKRRRKWILRILSNYLLRDAVHGSTRKVRLLSAQLIVVQREFPCTHKYDGDMEILLNAGERKLLRISIYQSFATVAKFAVNFFYFPQLHPARTNTRVTRSEEI